jgi:hypothetical protein
MRTAYLKLTLQSCSLELCHLGFISGLPSSSLKSVVANEPGGNRGELVNSIHRMSDSIINNLLFGVGDYYADRIKVAE